MYLPPPTLDNPTYTDAYAKILTAHRTSPSISASSVLILSAPDVDALCAARMLADLFRQDDVIYRIMPVSGVTHLNGIKDYLREYLELRTLILLNIGGLLDLPGPEWFQDFPVQLTIHVIDSIRPQSLASLFGLGLNHERVIVWDDGYADKLIDEKKAFQSLQYEPLYDSDESDPESEPDEQEQTDDEDEDASQSGHTSKKRRSLGDDSGKKKRRKLDEYPPRMSREERDLHNARISKHYNSGTSHGQSVAGTIYVLATVLERVDSDLLWLAILGLTFQYTTARISRQTYEAYHAIFHDEVVRLNPPLPQATNSQSLISLNPDDLSVRATDELRFMLFRHWTLYDAMYHSSYVASKLGIWKERGRKRLTGLLAKMGFSIPQTQQPYPHMDLDLKKTLLQRLNDIAPEYGLVELSYPSFMRCFGYHSQPLSAADAVEGISALLDVAGGVRMEVEIEGARNGGEWFGGGRVWEAHGTEKQTSKTLTEQDKETEARGTTTLEREGDKPSWWNLGDSGVAGDNPIDVPWWVKNYWAAFDALDNITALNESLNLAMSLHRAIIRQGTSIIDKQDIRTMRNHRVVILTQGPDLPLFSHPAVLSRLALWLVDALRDRIPGVNVSQYSKRKSLPFVVACLNETSNKFVVVGVMAALDFGDVRKNEFGLTFLDAVDRCNTESRHVSFDTNVLEIPRSDLNNFLHALCEQPEQA